MDLTQVQLDKIAKARKLAATSFADWKQEHGAEDIAGALAAMSGVENYYLHELLDIIDALTAATQ
jgi:hypothetical protein